MTRHILALFFALTLPSFVLASQWLCVTDLSTGFHYDRATKNWREATFEPGGKFIITHSDTDGISYEVKRVGQDIAACFCPNDYDQNGYLYCSGFFNFKFNKKNGRFIYTYPIGYVNILPDNKQSPTDDKSDDVIVSIGKCGLLL